MPRPAAVKKPNHALPPPIPQPAIAPVEQRAQLIFNVDWQGTPMPVAQQLYAQIQAEYHRAGVILNARSSPREIEQFYCFMAGSEGACQLGKIHQGKPCFIDLHYKAPKGGYKDPMTDQVTTEGLNVPVRICTERCYHLYNALLIAQRRERLNPEVNG